MLAKQRQSRILGELRRRGGVRVSDLTALLHVSDMTVRRDLEELARQGVVEKVHGGAVLAERRAEEPGFAAKSLLELPAKEAIARHAAALVTPGAAVAIGAGTTTWLLARELTAVPDITVVTNSPVVADVLYQAGDGHGRGVILTGGVRTRSDALVGPIAEAAIRSLHVDVLFLGVHGIDAAAGLTTPNLAEAETNRAFLARTRRVVVVADHTKWGLVGLASFGPLSAADVLVTDEGVADDAVAALGDAVGDLIIAPVEPVRAARRAR